MKFLSERLIWHVASQISELIKMTSQHREVLHIARTQFDSPEKMREVPFLIHDYLKVLVYLTGDGSKEKGRSVIADAFLQRTAIIGQIVSFRDAVHTALRHVLEARLPFLISSFNNLWNSLDEEVY